MPPDTEEQREESVRDDQSRDSEYAAAWADIQGDLNRIEAELDDCQRLTEQDFAVRINARD